MGAGARGKDAEHEHREIAERHVVPDPAAKRQSIEAGQHDFRHEQGWADATRVVERHFPIIGECDYIAGPAEEERLKLADVRVTFCNENEWRGWPIHGASERSGLTRNGSGRHPLCAAIAKREEHRAPRQHS